MTTITRFTKEQLIARAREKVKSLEFAVTQTAFAENRAELEEELELARIALASLEAEPVGEVVLGEYDDFGCHPDARVACIAADGQADWENFKDGTRLYAAPPSLVEIDEREAFNAWNDDENLPIAGVGAKNAAWLAWQARAAMLQGKAENNEGEPTDDERIMTIEGILPPLNPGNSPVIPDGWVMVPVEPTTEMLRAGFLAGEDYPGGVYRAMLAAAPQQGVK